MIGHAARLSPLVGETAWRLEDGVLIQQQGKKATGFPLASLTRLTLTPAGARRAYASASLAFGLERLTIPSASFGPRGVEPRADSFAKLLRAVAIQGKTAAPKARFVLTGAVDRRSPLLWAIALIGVGALSMAMMSFNPSSIGIGLSLASRLAFVGLLLGAILPWIGAGGREFDPAAIPSGALPV